LHECNDSTGEKQPAQASTVASVAVMSPMMQTTPSTMSAIPSATNQPQEWWILSRPALIEPPIVFTSAINLSPG
jgi:hypothetical protein